MPQTEIDRIVDELDREYRGDPWHGSPLTDILAGVDYRQAGARPMPGAHTIWELVLHMTGWKREVTRRLGGAPAGEPAEGDWPPPPVPSAEAWSDALAGLDRAHGELLDAVRRVPDTQLFEPTNDPRNRETGAGVTHYVLLHGIVQHDAYHAGQVALLRKALVRAAMAG